MERKVLLTVNYKGKPLEIVQKLIPEGFSLITMETTSQDELEIKAADADYILASGKLKISRKVVNEAKKLRMVQRLGVGLDSLDFEALNERDIPVYVNAGVNAASVAEHAVMFILASLRRLTIINDNTKKGIWKKQEQGIVTRELSTQIVGIVGIGNIGKKVAKILNAFDCRILYFDVNRLSMEIETDLHIEYKDLESLLRLSDVITLHCPLTDETKNIICEKNIRLMKKGVIIVNTSRGGLINEDNLLVALEKGEIGFAALDVFDEEPLNNFHLVRHENVMCTPHIAGNSYDAFSRMMECAFENLYSFDIGKLDEIEKHRVVL